MAKTAPFTREQFTEAITAAVAERGADFVYDKTKPGWSTPYGDGVICVYQTEDGEPACIIGAALAKIDPDLVPPHTSTTSALALLSAMGVDFYTTEAASDAQAAQDFGHSWGRALTAYMQTIKTAPKQED